MTLHTLECATTRVIWTAYGIVHRSAIGTSNLDAEIAKLQQARSLLVALGTPKAGKAKKIAAPAAAKPKRTMSAKGRKAIADAQKKRWAEKKKEAK